MHTIRVDVAVHERSRQQRRYITHLGILRFWAVLRQRARGAVASACLRYTKYTLCLNVRHPHNALLLRCHVDGLSARVMMLEHAPVDQQRLLR